MATIRNVYRQQVLLETRAGMRVLLLPAWYLPEGGQFVRHQAIALREQGVDVRILANVTLGWHKYKWQAFNVASYPLTPFFTEEDGIQVLRSYTRPVPKATVLNIRLWTRRTLRMYDAYVQRYGHPDLIHAHSATWAAYAAALIKQKYGTPYVLTEHRGMFGCRSDYAREFFRKEFEPFFRIGFSSASCIIPVSDQLIPTIRTYCDRDVPFRVISNMVDTDYFCPLPRTRASQTVEFVSVNGFYREKGYDILLPAWDLLCDRRKDVHLTIVGENFDRPDFRVMWSSCRHQESVTFTGELTRDGVRENLRKADAFVISSRVEAEPVAVLEAMATGLPVVASDVVPEYEMPSSCGIRVPVEDPVALADALDSMADSFGRYDSAAIRNHTIAIASRRNVTAQLIDVYGPLR